MFVSAEPTILHADADSFFASVEQRDDPRAARPAGDRRRRRRARRELRGQGVRGAHGDGRPAGAPALPGRGRRPAAHDRVHEASKALFAVFEDTTPLVEGLSIDEAFLDVARDGADRGHAARDRERLRREVRERVGLPVTVGIARTKFLAKVASAVAKPDGLLVVPPDGELDVPASAAGRARSGASARRRRRKLRARGITTVGDVARVPEARARGDARPRLRAAPARAREQPRPAAGRTVGRAAAVDRLAARVRPRAGARAEELDADLVGARRPRDAPRARRRSGRADGRAAAALRRLHPGDAFAHAARRRRRGRRRVLRRPRAGCSPRRSR